MLHFDLDFDLHFALYFALHCILRCILYYILSFFGERHWTFLFLQNPLVILYCGFRHIPPTFIIVFLFVNFIIASRPSSSICSSSPCLH